MLHHIALHCDATEGVSMSPLGLYHIWVLPALESLPYFEWYQMLHCIASPELHCITLHCIALQPQSCIALHCSPRYLHVPYPAFISTWILSIFETLSYSTDNIFKSPWPCQPVQPLSKCEAISSKSLWPFQTTQPWQSFQTCQKGFDPFPNRRTNFPHQRQLKPKLIVVKLSNQKSPTLSIFLHDKHRSFIMII